MLINDLFSECLNNGKDVVLFEAGVLRVVEFAQIHRDTPGELYVVHSNKLDHEAALSECAAREVVDVPTFLYGDRVQTTNDYRSVATNPLGAIVFGNFRPGYSLDWSFWSAMLSPVPGLDAVGCAFRLPDQDIANRISRHATIQGTPTVNHEGWLVCRFKPGYPNAEVKADLL